MWLSEHPPPPTLRKLLKLPCFPLVCFELSPPPRCFLRVILGKDVRKFHPCPPPINVLKIPAILPCYTKQTRPPSRTSMHNRGKGTELAEDLSGPIRSRALSSEVNSTAVVITRNLHRKEIESEALPAQSKSKAILRTTCHPQRSPSGHALFFRLHFPQGVVNHAHFQMYRGYGISSPIFYFLSV